MTNWDSYFEYELLHRAHEPVDFRRWKKASQRALRELYPGADVRVLDATCGLGDHTVNLAELGFLTEASDRSAVARAATEKALGSAGLNVPIHDVLWEKLGATFPARFDLIWNDAIHWIEEPRHMHDALVGARDALKPGGALVFFFADGREPDPNAGARVLAWDKEHLATEETAWEHDGITHRIVRTFSDTHIDELHVFEHKTNGGNARRVDVPMRRVYRWDFHAMSQAVRAAGFAEIKSDTFTNDKGHTFAMNRAVR